jgi:hypothetical protein
MTPEEKLRQLLTEAVEPVQPGPGAQARLQAKIRQQRAPRDVRRGLRWAGAVLGTAAVVSGAAVAINAQHGHSTDSSASSASSAKTGSANSDSTSSGKVNGPMAGPSAADSRSATTPNVETTAGAGGAAPAAQASPPSYAPAAGDKSLSGGTTQKVPEDLSPLARSITPLDLNGDNQADVLTLTDQRLIVKFSNGSQSATLPQVSTGARVLGVTELRNASGTWTPVAFVRLEASPGYARETLVAVVDGKLTVLRLSGKPVQLTVTAAQGYTCAGSLIVTAGGVFGYVVSGADLVSDGSTGNAAKAGSNCGFS